jgi:hypothetical protein
LCFFLRALFLARPKEPSTAPAFPISPETQACAVASKKSAALHQSQLTPERPVAQRAACLFLEAEPRVADQRMAPEVEQPVVLQVAEIWPWAAEEVLVAQVAERLEPSTPQ